LERLSARLVAAGQQAKVPRDESEDTPSDRIARSNEIGLDTMEVDTKAPSTSGYRDGGRHRKVALGYIKKAHRSGTTFGRPKRNRLNRGGPAKP